MDLTTLERLPLWIGGRTVSATTTRYGEVTNPATGEVIRHVPLANHADVDQVDNRLRPIDLDPDLRAKGGASDLVQQTFLEILHAAPRFDHRRLLWSGGACSLAQRAGAEAERREQRVEGRDDC